MPAEHSQQRDLRNSKDDVSCGHPLHPLTHSPWNLRERRLPYAVIIEIFVSVLEALFTRETHFHADCTTPYLQLFVVQDSQLSRAIHGCHGPVAHERTIPDRRRVFAVAQLIARPAKPTSHLELVHCNVSDKSLPTTEQRVCPVVFEQDLRVGFAVPNTGCSPPRVKRDEHWNAEARICQVVSPP